MVIISFRFRISSVCWKKSSVIMHPVTKRITSAGISPLRQTMPRSLERIYVHSQTFCALGKFMSMPWKCSSNSSAGLCPLLLLLYTWCLRPSQVSRTALQGQENRETSTSLPRFPSNIIPAFPNTFLYLIESENFSMVFIGRDLTFQF